MNFQPVVEQRQQHAMERQEMAPLPQDEDELYDVLYEFPTRNERNIGDGSSNEHSRSGSRSRPKSISSFYAAPLAAPMGGQEDKGTVNE